MNPGLAEQIRRLQGPVLVLGASGFIGGNLLRTLLPHRSDVYGTVFHAPAWRLDGVPARHVVVVDLLAEASLNELFERLKPRTIFNCVGYGGYSFECDSALIYETNFNLTAKVLERLESLDIACYVHAGSSSEYGATAAAAKEDDFLEPNSDYAVSKVASAHLVRLYGKSKRLPCANLRLFSAYGPLEDASRLIPTLIERGLQGTFPAFVDANISRDFVYIDDVSRAFIDTALNLREPFFGESFNVGSGTKTTIADVAKAAAELFSITEEPAYGLMPSRAWDLVDWSSDQSKTSQTLGWSCGTDFREGLRRTAEWYRGLLDKGRYQRSSKQFGADRARSVSAIVACYKDAQAIPIMYERLKTTFAKLRIEHEIIFVNDGSPDDSEAIIRSISSRDRHVIGIAHSRNFGSQAAFRSGMEIATKNACVLLDGDLQDPAELIEAFVEKWKQGFDVVYGIRVEREASLFMRVACKLFYRLFDALSYLPIPHDAGDFSLIDRRAVEAILQHSERDFFLRGIRASVGFKQTGVDYVRPARRFGRTTNSFFKNVGWAKKGILAFSFAPLLGLSLVGTGLFLLTIALCIGEVASRLLHPGMVRNGATAVALCILFFGSLNIVAIATVGEYMAKVLEETKRRPHFIRKSIIISGEVRQVSDSHRAR
ncbi:MAG: NAD-dependent epimerase/dehydratase family protein [Myxococcales bacterium]